MHNIYDQRDRYTATGVWYYNHQVICFLLLQQLQLKETECGPGIQHHFYWSFLSLSFNP